MDDKTILVSFFKDLNIDYDNNKIDKINKFLDLLYNRNLIINLVGTKNKNQILIRHFFDSLSILKFHNTFFGSRCKVLDVGSGAGMPGVLLAIMRENDKFYLLDKKKKRTAFLKKAVDLLELKNVIILEGNAELIAHDGKYRETFNLVLSRAVAKFNILSEIIIPFSKIKGRIVYYKSKKIFGELEKGKKVINLLGGEIENLTQVKVPFLNEFRAFLSIVKKRNSSYKYPRKYAIIKKSPIK